MVADEGIEAISMREVARRAGVSSGGPFLHFQDRNAPLAAIAEEGYRV
jgi:AcrR family transcriptional regulator